MLKRLRHYLAILRFRLINISKPLLRMLKVDVVVANYYSPIPDVSSIRRSMCSRSEMAGIEMNEHSQLELLADMQSHFKAEYEKFPTVSNSVPCQYYTSSKTFKAVDAAVLYSMVRKLAPKQIIEAGSGDSTRLISQALMKNETEGVDCRYRVIDPYPSDFVRNGLPGLSHLTIDRVENIPISAFKELSARDILFIDSSHVLKSGGDVQFEFLEVLPRLGPGVYVHVHDIYLPADYPESYFAKGYYLTEQYLLQAFLTFNREYEVIWASHFMHLNHPEKLAQAVNAYNQEGRLTCSFWFKRTD